MARIRTLKPEFWKHEALSELPEATHILAAALLNYADDYGYFNANVGLIRAECTPLREPSVSLPESLRSLQAVKYIRLGTGADGKRYGHIIAFEDHQRVSHPAKSKIADKSIVWDDSGNPPEDARKSPEPLRPEQGTGNGKEQGTGNREVAPAALAHAPVELSDEIGKLSTTEEITSKPNNDGPKVEILPPERLGSAPPPIPEIPPFLDARKRATRWDAEREVPGDWIQAAGAKRAEMGLPSIDLRYEAERFKNYWASKSGQQATKVDWRLTWMNWATDKTKTDNGNGSGQRKRTAHDSFLAAGASLIRELDDQQR